MSDACRNCRRLLHWVDGIGWLHGELPQYANRPLTCENAVPACSPRPFSPQDPGCQARHLNGPDPLCGCSCHWRTGSQPKPRT